MANWVEGYFDELYREEQLTKIGEGLAAGIKDALERPGTARVVMPAVPLQATSGSMPVKTVKLNG